MDKLLEHPEFTGCIRRILHVAFVAGEESGWSNLKAQVDFGTYDPSASDSRSSYSLALDDALLGFTTMDFVGLLGLGHLDMVGVRALCAFDEGVVGLGVGAGGGGDGNDDGVAIEGGNGDGDGVIGGGGNGDGDGAVGGGGNGDADGDGGGGGNGDGDGVAVGGGNGDGGGVAGV
ncbi:uncharacterized protein LOC111915500 [Lactuca sativa]|uniref:uncharacterized protein LOC111915500 n=1 Tax=Lactuca sativa TaxID=4236 RepID=UPI000CD84D85|nr:uncharacterized protein LOC111915500 [Lactuca sativa]